jgi:hypothetical protein
MTRDAAQPEALNSRFFPRNWVMLSNYGEDTPRCLLNIASGASIVDDFSELSGAPGITRWNTPRV